MLDTLRSLEHGPWWPPLGELIDAARRFYAGGLAETQPGHGLAHRLQVPVGVRPAGAAVRRIPLAAEQATARRPRR